MQKIKWALIGCGKVVLQNKTTPFINRYNKIVAICTTNIDHSNAAIDKLKLKKCNGYDNVFKMLEKESIDAIYICTPPKFHFDYLKILSKYHIPIIYVEKPFVLNKKQANEILHEYKKSSTKIFVAHYKRLTPQIQKLKKIIATKTLGDVLYIEGVFNRVFNHQLLYNSWIYKKEISGGGRFFDISPHILDILYYIFGNFQNIKSQVYYEQKEHSCESGLKTSFKINNINCSLSFDFKAKKDEDILIIHCTKGIIKTSINRDTTVYLYNNSKVLIKAIKFKKIKTWGIEAINTIDRLLYGKSYNTDIANLNDAYIIQTYIEEMLKKGVT